MKQYFGIGFLFLFTLSFFSRCKKASPEPPTTPGTLSEYIVTTYAGTGQVGFINGPSTQARFSFPSFITADSKGNVFVADRGNNVIRKISPSGDVTTLAGSGAIGSQDGLGVQASFRLIEGLAVDTTGNIYVSDYCRIRKISPAGLVSTIAGSPIQGNLDGQDTAARFSWVKGLAVDIQGNVYVADGGNGYNCIRKISPSGLVSTLAGGTIGNVDGSGQDARFGYLVDIAIAPSGNLIISDIANRSLRMATGTGQVSTVYRKPVDENFEPRYLTIDAGGTIYLSQEFFSSGALNSFNSVYRVTNGKLASIAGSGAAGYMDGDGLQVSFKDNWGLAFDPQGNILVADRGNHCIRKIKKR